MAGIIKAVLGPTNTGKTHYAVERMLAYSSGVMGFPLRLLAREVYDRVVAVKGKNQVALLTGEERIVPEGARYFMCTAEAMPRYSTTDFVAIDEIQMAADPQRGYIFTEHLLHSRGKHETLFLGAETMRHLIQRLIPEAEILTRPRFSNLSHIRPTKITRMPRRSAIVGFSSSDVYGMAELIKRQKGGAAIVMGALSPRTRNAQVEMYQSGEVDHLVATDAIGMGLNLDVGHVAFAGLQKFDGRTFRDLTAAEAGQIAGRAGRYKKDGTFSTLGGGEGDAMDPMMVAQIEEHQFEPVKRIFWRNHRLSYASIPRLLRSLDEPATTDGLHRTREATDYRALKVLGEDEEIARLANNPESVERLWNVCQIPDFRKLSQEDHISLLRRIYVDLMGPAGRIPHDWVAKQVKRLDNCHGDIDTLAGRIASIRIWTYVSQRKNWLQDSAHWAHVTRSVEDKLSDALHEKLTQRFVDRRTAVLMRSLRQRGELSVSIDNDTNKVSVEGHEIGELNGFSFRVEPGAARDDQKTLKAAAEQALQAELTRRAKLFANIGVKTLEFNFEEGLAFPKLMWEGAPVATVHDSGALFGPRVKLVANTLLTGENAELVLSKTQEWLDTRIAEKLEPLVKLAQELNGEVEAPEDAAPLTGLARGVAFRLLENYGVMSRKNVDGDLRQLDQEARKGLRRFGIRIGASSLYMPLVMKPHATELRLLMWAMAGKISALPTIPTPGMVWVETETTAPDEFYELAGFVPVGKKAVRMDMLERLADAVRPLGQNVEWFEVTPEIMGLVGLSGEDFADVMKAAGYKHEVRKIAPEPKAEEPKAEADAETPVEGEEKPAEETAPEAVEAPAEEAKAETAEAPAEENTEEVSVEEELVERFFFQWAPKRKPRAGGRPQGNRDGGKPQGKGRGPKGKGKGGKPSGPRTHSARPPKREKQADPDSPFAALAGLKDALTKK
ncbi:helicase-related protein [Kordiimonas laminariae]|uniref:helicase-related protein n=1 Tax=Kordiimonas laminariae TaxID=2917717 RepID=UPI001FF3963D|nr:helicase-related protein [Kordiimonas laminariae]MCK0070036.1 hypothetical protein [Kordiimonas laminariae]